MSLIACLTVKTKKPRKDSKAKQCVKSFIVYIDTKTVDLSIYHFCNVDEDDVSLFAGMQGKLLAMVDGIVEESEKMGMKVHVEKPETQLPGKIAANLISKWGMKA